MTTPVTNTSANDGTIPASSAVQPSEVGWQFVPQYYNYVNKYPNRLHCFYTKASTFSHGTEGEDGKPYFGQQEIHTKIQSIGYEDCKVFIHSVDAQSSANNGIIIQVIGELSNRGEAWRKFVQTFFLAEQPNGYFVLNDIFRFMREEAVDGEDEDEEVAGDDGTAQEDEVEQEQEQQVQPEPEAEAPVTAAAAVGVPEEAPAVSTETEVLLPPAPADAPVDPQPEPAAESPTTAAEPEPAAPAPAPVEAAQPAAEAPAPAAESKPKTNGVHHEESKPQPAAAAPAEKPSAPSPAPPTSGAAGAAPVVAPTPTGPPAPKTWASMAATNSKKWGTAVATESRGLSEAAPSAPSTPVAGAPGGVSRQNSARGGGQQSGAAAIQAISTPGVFIKGVLENVTQNALTSHLTTQFGPIKELEIVRSRACAFAEFTTVEAAKRAITASLPQNQGGQGGVWLDVEGGPQVKIVIETRKERGERPPSRPRGGAPAAGGERGGGTYRGGNPRGGSGPRGGRGGGQGQK